MKYYKYIWLIVIISILPLTCKAYEYVNKNNESSIKQFRKDVYDLRDLYEDLIPEEDEQNFCDTVPTTVYSECRGVTVNGYGTYSLEEYVAGVVKSEFGASASNDENRYKISKVNAIAARSFVVSQGGCNKTVNSSPTYQVFNPIDKNNQYDKIYLKAAMDTAGQVIVKNGKVQSGYFVTVPTSMYITKLNGNWTFDMLGDPHDESTKYTYTMPESDIMRISSYTGGLVYPDESSGHHWGIPTVGAAYEVEKGTSTEEILNMFYGKDIKLATLSGIDTSSNEKTDSGNSLNSEESENNEEKDSDTSCVISDDNGEGKNSEYVNVNGVSFPVKNYNIEGTSNGLSKYYNLNVDNVSQCPWYAKYRAIEIIMTSSLSKNLKSKAKAVLTATNGNGNQWYAGTNSTLKYFKYTNDVTKPKAGSIVSWEMNGHSYGHVGIIEKVYSDGSVLLSDGWNRFGADSGNGVNSIKIMTRKMTQSELATYNGSGSFKGYTYLFSYKE